MNSGFYENRLKFLFKLLLKHKDVSSEGNYIVHNEHKIALYMRSNRTSGGLKKKQKRAPTNVKRKHHVVALQNSIVTTSKAMSTEMSVFFKNHQDYTLILICGTFKHEQCVFVRKTAIPGYKKKRQYIGKVYDPNLLNRKVTKPLKSLLDKMSLTFDNKSKLIYDAATHRLTNTGLFCGPYVALEIRNAIIENRTPFTRKNVKFFPTTTR